MLSRSLLLVPANKSGSQTAESGGFRQRTALRGRIGPCAVQLHVAMRAASGFSPLLHDNSLESGDEKQYRRDCVTFCAMTLSPCRSDSPRSCRSWRVRSSPRACRRHPPNASQDWSTSHQHRSGKFPPCDAGSVPHQSGACGLKVGWRLCPAAINLPSSQLGHGLQIYNDTETAGAAGDMAAISQPIDRARLSPSVRSRPNECLGGAQTLALVGCGFEGNTDPRSFVPSTNPFGDARCASAIFGSRPWLSLRTRRQRTLLVKSFSVGTTSYLSRERTSSLPARTATTRSCNPNGSKPGAFAVAIEAGCARGRGLHLADKFMSFTTSRWRNTSTKSPPSYRPMVDQIRIFLGMPTIDATIGEIVAGNKTGSGSNSEPIIVIPIGMAIAQVCPSASRVPYCLGWQRGMISNDQRAVATPHIFGDEIDSPCPSRPTAPSFVNHMPCSLAT